MSERRLPASDATAILRTRAEKLALSAPAAPAEAPLQFLEFALSGERYAVETRHVRELYPLRNLTPLPSTRAFLAGIVNVRGRIVPVIDLKKFFDLPGQGLTDGHRIIIVAGPDVEAGLLADMSAGVVDVPRHDLQPAPSVPAGIGSEFLKGVTVERLIVLDVDRILTDPRFIVNDEVGSE